MRTDSPDLGITPLQALERRVGELEAKGTARTGRERAELLVLYRRLVRQYRSAVAYVNGVNGDLRDRIAELEESA